MCWPKSENRSVLGEDMDKSLRLILGPPYIKDRHIWIWIYPWVSTRNLWIWIWIWMGNFISTATLQIDVFTWLRQFLIRTLVCLKINEPETKKKWKVNHWSHLQMSYRSSEKKDSIRYHQELPPWVQITNNWTVDIQFTLACNASRIVICNVIYP